MSETLNFEITAGTSDLTRAINAAKNGFESLGKVAAESFNNAQASFEQLRTDIGKGLKIDTSSLEALAAKGNAVYHSTRTAAEQLEAKQKELNALFKAGAIDAETLGRALQQAEAKSNGLGASHQKLGGHINSVAREMRFLLFSYEAFEAVKGLGVMTETMMNLDGQIRRFTTSEVEFRDVQKDLLRISGETRTGMEATAQLFTRAGISLQQYGYNTQQVLKFTELTNKAMATGGASAEEQKSALMQLSQALASGTLAGDEFKSMAENSPIFLDIMSKSLKVTRGELRQMAKDGELTTKAVTDAILGQSEMIDAAYKKLPLNVGGALANLKTKMMGMLDAGLVQTGMWEGLANVIQGSTTHLGTIALAAVAVGAAFVSTLFVGAVAAELGLLAVGAAALEATGALLLAAASNPFTIAIVAIGLACVALFEYRDAIITINGEQTTIGETASDVWEGVKATVLEGIDSIIKWWKSATTDANASTETTGTTWADVWDGIKSVTSSVCKFLFDITYGLGQNICNVFTWACDVAKAAIASLVAAAKAAFSSAADAADKFLSGDFKGAANAIDGSADNIVASMKKAFNDAPIKSFVRASDQAIGAMERIRQKGHAINASNAANAREMKRLTAGKKGNSTLPPEEDDDEGGGGGGGKGKKGGKGGKGGKGSKGKSNDGKESKQFDEELATVKRAYQLNNELRELSKDDEVKFWQKKRAVVTKGSKDEAEVKKKLAQAEFERDKALLKNKIDIDALTLEHTQKAAEAILEAEGAEAQWRKDNDEISSIQLLAIQTDLENRHVALVTKGVRDRMAVLAKDPTKNAVELAKLNAQIVDLETAHQKKLTELSHAKITAQKADMAGITGAMTGLWDKGIDAMLNGTLRWKTALKTIFADIGKAFLNVGSDMAKNWIKKNAEMLLSDRLTKAKLWIAENIFGAKKIAIKAVTAAKEKAIDASSFATSQKSLLQSIGSYIAGFGRKIAAKLGFAVQEKAVDTTSTAAQIAANAAKATSAIGLAGANGVASFAAAPWPINIGAPAFGLEMAAAAGSFSILSAAGGFDIPAGLNPKVQLHEKEMVLPAKHAAVIRSLANGGGSGSSGDTIQHFNVTLNDSSGNLSDEQIFRKSRVIAQALKNEMRNFNVKRA